MIIKNKKNNTKRIAGFTVAVLFFIVVSVAILEKLHFINIFNNQSPQQNTTQKRNSTKINNDPATNEQIKNGNDIKSSSGSDTPLEPAVVEGSDKKKVQLIISAANQINNLLQIRVIIGAIENNGQCNLSLTKGVTTIKKMSNIQPQASTSTCKGFDVPISELSSGTWLITINYSSDKLTGTVNQDIVLR